MSEPDDAWERLQAELAHRLTTEAYATAAYILGEHRASIDAARSSHPDQLEVTLDVDRLARAIHGGRLPPQATGVRDWLCDCHDMLFELCPAAPHRLHAEAIAREYAALSSPEPRKP